MEDDIDINENLIDNINKNNNQDKLPIEKTALKSDSENILEVNDNLDDKINSNIDNNNIDNLNSNAPLLKEIIIEDNIKKTDTFISNEKKKKK